ncbi:MAG: tRNA dihydrouridine synthase DusB [Oscillospiraceae bacterium]|nr:tRNA dihydrouridine synthase DusB [Oscillospiraceae bacterium]
MKKDIQSIIAPGAIGLAPMAGVTDSSFRALCRSCGAAFCVGEMVSAKALCLGDKKTPQLLRFSEAERPIGLQLFGHDPADMAQAARFVEERFHPDFIDINMGCPAPKITGAGAGSALMKTPQLAAYIVAAVNAAVSAPVTVKMRAGWEENTAVELALLLQAAGAAALTVHGRTRARMYKPPADLELIRQVKRAVRIPVVGNGDVFTSDDALRMFEATGCDAVMVGRGALGNPFLFRTLATAVHGEAAPAPPTARERMDALRRQVESMVAEKGAYVAFCEARKHAAWYTKGFRGAAYLRSRANTIADMADLDHFIQLVLAETEGAQQDKGE